VDSADGIDSYGQAIERPPPHIIVALLPMHLKQLRKKVLGEEMDISLTWRTAGGADASVLFVNIIISDNYICMYKDPDLPSTLKLIDTGCTLTCRTASSCSPRLQQGL
jgi:hypothetical protein